MPRVPKPFFHRGWWVTDVGGERTKLVHGRENREQAKKVLHELLAKASYSPAGKTTAQLAVSELCERFLEWVEIHRSAKTFTDYHDWLSRWVKLHGKRRARDIRPLDLEQWKAALVKSGKKPCTVNHAIVAVKCCWSWGLKIELLPVNPLSRVEKLFTEGRQRIVTPEEFRSLLRHSDAIFRQVLLVLRLTGLRPAEFCQLSWEQVNWKSHCLVIAKHKTVRKTKRPRIVPLPPIVENLLSWRLKHFGQTERVFLNERGRPWKYNALRCRMRRLREKAGIELDERGENLVLYSTRHTFATNAIAAGVSDQRLAELMGHTNTRTTQKYVHLTHRDLLDAAVVATSNYISPK